MTEPRDTILDAFLDEMLTGATPSRTAADIARTLQANAAENGHAESGPGEAAAGSIERAVTLASNRRTTIAASGAVSRRANATDGSSSTGSGRGNLRSILALAAGLLLTTGVIVWSLWPDAGPRDPRLVNHENPGEDTAFPDSPGDDGFLFAETPLKERDRRTPRNGIDGPTDRRNDSQPEFVEPPSVASNDVPADQTALVNPPPFERQPLPELVPADSNEVARQVDDRLRRAWQTAGLEPVEPLALNNWTTRLVTRLIGRTPTADEQSELNRLVAGSGSDEEIRASLVDRVLTHEDLADEFANHWGQLIAWRLLGISPEIDSNDADIQRTREFMTDQIAAETPLDATIYNLVSVVGSTRPDSDRFQPAASYLVGLNKRFGNIETAGAHLAGTLLGRSMKCARCHDSSHGVANSIDMLATQEEFYGFESFLAQLRFEPDGDNNHYYVVNRNFLPFGNEGRVEAPLPYTGIDGEQRAALPRLGDLAPAANGFVAKVDRRSLLASHVAASSEFREALVEHVWIALLNVPMSGIDGSRAAAAPELLEIREMLASQWAANDFQLPWLVRTIVLTDAFSAGVGTDEQLAANNPFRGAAPRFNQFYPRMENQRSAVGSLTIVANAYRNKRPDDALSAGLLARIDGQAATATDRVIRQNLPTRDNQWATSPSISADLDAIAASSMSSREKIGHLILAASGRSALEEEIEQGLLILDAASDERVALQDIWWSLLNSVESDFPLNGR